MRGSSWDADTLIYALSQNLQLLQDLASNSEGMPNASVTGEKQASQTSSLTPLTAGGGAITPGPSSIGEVLTPSPSTALPKTEEHPNNTKSFDELMKDVLKSRGNGPRFVGLRDLLARHALLITEAQLHEAHVHVNHVKQQINQTEASEEIRLEDASFPGTPQTTTSKPDDEPTGAALSEGAHESPQCLPHSGFGEKRPDDMEAPKVLHSESSRDASLPADVVLWNLETTEFPEFSPIE